MTAVIILLLVILYTIVGLSLTLFGFISDALDSGEIWSPAEVLIHTALYPAFLLMLLVLSPFDDKAREKLTRSKTVQVTRIIDVGQEHLRQMLNEQEPGDFVRPRRNIP